MDKLDKIIKKGVTNAYQIGYKKGQADLIEKLTSKETIRHSVKKWHASSGTAHEGMKSVFEAAIKAATEKSSGAGANLPETKKKKDGE